MVTRCSLPPWLARTKAWPVFLARVLGAMVTFPRLRYLTRRFRPCVAYTNSWVIPEGAVVARTLRLPHLWHIREYEPGNESLRSQLPLSFVRRQTERWSSELLAVSSSVAGQFEGAAVPVQVVHAGVETSHPEATGAAANDWLAAGEPGLLLLGTISRAKGVFVAIEAMAHIRSWLPGARLLVVGRGTTATLRDVQATIDRLDLQDCVRVEPFTPDPASLMRCSDIVVMPARHEAYGLVTVEAMSAGRPVVGTATGGTKDLLSAGGGLLAGLDDPLHFAGHVCAIATDRALYTWLTDHGRATADALDQDAEAGAVEDAVQRLCPAAASRA